MAFTKQTSVGSRRSFLQEPSVQTDDGLFVVSGVAIGPGDVTHHEDEETGEIYTKVWTAEGLRQAAHTLEGRNIVGNHENDDIHEVLGEITQARYEEDVGIVYQGVINEEDVAEKINNGWLEVSARLIHGEPTETTDEGHRVVDDVWLVDNLAVVTTGNAPSNEIELGESEMLSVEELDAMLDSPDDVLREFAGEELQEYEGRDLTRWLYETREGAQGATEGIECEGTHEHVVDEETYYMPCSSHEKFLQALEEKEENELEDGECPCGEVEENEEEEEMADTTLEVELDIDTEDVEERIEELQEKFEELVDSADDIEELEAVLEEEESDDAQGDDRPEESEPTHLAGALGVTTEDADN